LCGIVTSKDGPIKLTVESLNQACFSISIINVGVMNITHLWGGDIISDVSLFPLKSAPNNVLQCLYCDRISDDETIADAVSKDGRQYLFVLECSYGANIYATCDKMEIISEMK
jgi:hypothetical protein